MEDQYVMFPLCLLQGVYKDFNGSMNLIIAHGIIDYANRIKIDKPGAYRHLIYSFYRKRETITGKLEEIIYCVLNDEYYPTDEYFAGFDVDASFNPEEELESLFLAEEEYPELPMLAMNFQRMSLARKNLNVTGDNEATYRMAQEAKNIINAHEQKFGKDPFASLKISYLIDFRDANPNITDIQYFCAFAAIKSLIGNKGFVGTNKSAVAMRMLGARNADVLKEVLKTTTYKPVYARFTRRSPMDSMIKTLIKRGFLKSKIGWGKMIWLATKLDHQELAIKVVEHHKRNTHQVKSELEARTLITEKLKGN